MKVAPEPPGMNIPQKLKKSRHHPVEVEVRYRLIKGRVKKRLGLRFIEEPAGRIAYIRGSIYTILGRYKINGDLLDWDHELRSIEAKLDAKLRLKLLLHVAKRLKVRT